MSSEVGFEAGAKVRLRHDPAREGRLTGKVREQAGTCVYQVGFPERREYHPEYELELVEEDEFDPYELLEELKFGRAVDFRRNLSYVQLRGRLANLVYSMETTNTDFHPYQFKPVFSFLESPSNGLLIADEVGLGKTIEAGLLWTELRARYDTRRLLVVCPAMLREKWQQELKQRFSVDSRILNADELLSELKKSKHETLDGKALICSVQGIRPPSGWKDMHEENMGPQAKLAHYLEEAALGEPLVDMLIVDEAHYMRNPESQTAKLGDLLRKVSDNMALLSATPVNLHDDDLFHLLRLVDPESFEHKEIFPQVLEANEPLQIARRIVLDPTQPLSAARARLVEANTHSLLAGNNQLTSLLSDNIFNNQHAEESERVRLADRIERVNLLSHVVSRTRKADVTQLRVVRQPFTHFAELPADGEERRFYDLVTEAVRDYASSAGVNEGFLLATPQRQMSSCMYAAARGWQERTDPFSSQIYEDLGLDFEGDVNMSPLVEHLASVVVPEIDVEELKQQDSKYELFREVLKQYLNDHPREKVIVFSYFRKTLDYLRERLHEDGVHSRVLVGGMAETKQDVIDQFRDRDECPVLLSSEVASEGVDLQFARVIVNYDLPWNPMKVEQRIGRIDRIGQKADSITIWNMGYEDTIDKRVYDRLLLRLGVFEKALGGMEAVMGEKIAELTRSLFTDKLTREQEESRINQTRVAIQENIRYKEELENQASHLIAHGGYILEKVEAAHQFERRITDDDLIVYVQDYLDRYAPGHVLKKADQKEQVYRIKLPPSVAAELSSFVEKKRLHGQTRLFSGQEIRCRFHNKLGRSQDGLERISQFHPLVRFITHDLEQRGENYFPLVALEMPVSDDHDIESGIYAFVAKLWSFEGLRVEEELAVRCLALGKQEVLDPERSWNLLNVARVEGRDWQGVASEIDLTSARRAMEHCDEMIRVDFEKAREDRYNQNRDRVVFQLRSAEKRRKRDLQSLEDTLRTHKRKGQTRLIAPTEGRIASVKEKFEVQKKKLESRMSLSASPHDVCHGLIKMS